MGIYRFRELKEVFGYSLIGEWRGDLFNNNNVSIVINKKIFENRIVNRELCYDTIKHLIYLISLSPISSRNPINVVEETYRYRLDMKLDPTALFMGTIRIARVAMFDFRYKSTIYSLWELLGKFVNESKMQLCNINDTELYFSSIISEVTEEIYGKSNFSQNTSKSNDFELSKNNVAWFMLKNTDITYNVIKRTIRPLLYSSDASLRKNSGRRIVEKKPFELFRTFYKGLNRELKKVTSVYGICDEYNLSENPIVKWFMESEYYGKYKCISQAESCSDAPNYQGDNYKDGVCSNIKNTNNLFYQYGCGIEFIKNDIPEFENIKVVLRRLLDLEANETEQMLYSAIISNFGIDADVLVSEYENIKNSITNFMLSYIEIPQNPASHAGQYYENKLNDVFETIKKSLVKENNAMDVNINTKFPLKHVLDFLDGADQEIFERKLKEKVNLDFDKAIFSVKDINHIKRQFEQDAPLKNIFEKLRKH